MRVKIELAIVVDEKLKVIKSDYMKGEIETITELTKELEAYKKHFLTNNTHINCSVYVTGKIEISI